MNLDTAITGLRRQGRVYIHDSPIFSDANWLEYQEREKAFWRKKLEVVRYDPDPERHVAPFFNHWGVEMSFFRDKTVLEIGSGPFGFFTAISQIDREYLPMRLVIIDTLMDYYQQFQIASKMPENAFLIKAPGEDAPLPDKSFDIILTNNVIDHVRDAMDFLAECKRLLRPSGLLFFSVHIIPGLIRVFKPLLERFDMNHPYHFTKSQMVHMLHTRGLRLKKGSTISMIREEYIPPEATFLEKCGYVFGFLMMRSLYGIAELKGPGRDVHRP